MTREDFCKLTEKTVILDGATGSNLIKAGMPRGVSTELWILDHPQVETELIRAYLSAGSQIVYTPTFGCNCIRLKDFGVRDQLEELNKRLVELAKKTAAGQGYLAGDITTGGTILGATSEATYEEALDRYREQISVLAEAGVDLIVAETMINIDETVAAVEAAKEVCDLPIMCSMTVEADGSIFSGGTAQEAIETLQEVGADAVGVNCSVGPDQLLSVVENMKKVAAVPLLVKPNAGMPTITQTGEALYSMSPADFARHMKALVDAGADIVGGCCGTTPEYIEALCGALRE